MNINRSEIILEPYKNGFVFCRDRRCDKNDCLRHWANLFGVSNQTIIVDSFRKKDVTCCGFCNGCVSEPLEPIKKKVKKKEV